MVVAVENETSATPLPIIQGIKRSQVKDYENRGYTVGNGNAWMGYPEVNRSVFLVIQNRKTMKKTLLEIRKQALEINARSRITERFIELLRGKLIGTEVKYITTHYGDYLADYSVLKI